MKLIYARVAKTVEVDRERLFDYFIPIELPHIFTGFGLLPAVVKVSGQTGNWDIPGHSRTVHLSDRGTIVETVTSCQRPELFSYQLSNFTGGFGLLVADAIGIWKFNEIDRTTTEITWEYSFRAKSISAGIILKPIIELLFRAYMQQIIDTFSNLAIQNITRSI